MPHSTIIPNQNYGGLNPVLFGEQHCPPSHTYGPAVRDHYLIHYIVSGKGVFQTHGKKHHLGAGEMFFICPGEEISYQADKTHPWHYIWIGFTAEAALPCPLPHTMFAPTAAAVFLKMKECIYHENGKSAFLCARLWELFSLLLEKKSQEIDYVQYAIDCIHSEYSEPITVEEISSRLGLNRSYFSALFKRKRGISPKQYLFEYRMKIAARLLTEEKKPVSVVANSVGYSDIFNFSKMFKRFSGLSPTEYSKTHI